MESERKGQILDAAERLFSQRGYHATSMRELAQSLDLKGGSLYSHISGKEELLWRVLERAADEFMAAFEAASRAEAEPLPRLRAAIHRHVRVITDKPSAATVYFHEWHFLSEPQRSAFLARRDGYEQCFRALVAEALPGSDARWATLLILSALNWLYHWYRAEGPLSPDEIAERFFAMLMSGLGNGAEPMGHNLI